MVPVGIITRERVAYLDVTLKSLSATQLPVGAPVTIFDDGSHSKTAKNYYETAKPIRTTAKWPTDASWKKTLGLEIVNKANQKVLGLNGKVPVVTLARKPLGVVNASCRAITHLFKENPAAPGVFLLQDDIVFKEDWYHRMLDTVARAEEYTDKEVGLLAGLKLNYAVDKGKRNRPAVASGVTAQCLYISRQAHDVLYSSYINKKHRINRRFDDTFRKAVAKTDLWAGCIFPFVCQHIGIQSLVRPGKSWKRGRTGRVGYHVHPPYAMAAEVKKL